MGWIGEMAEIAACTWRVQTDGVGDWYVKGLRVIVLGVLVQIRPGARIVIEFVMPEGSGMRGGVFGWVVTVDRKKKRKRRKKNEGMGGGGSRRVRSESGREPTE